MPALSSFSPKPEPLVGPTDREALLCLGSAGLYVQSSEPKIRSDYEPWVSLSRALVWRAASPIRPNLSFRHTHLKPDAGDIGLGSFQFIDRAARQPAPRTLFKAPRRAVGS